MGKHGQRRNSGSVLSAVLGILMLIVIGALCALAGYYVGARQKPEQVTVVPGAPVPQKTLSQDGDLLSRSIPHSNTELRDEAVRLKFAPLGRGDLAFDMVVPKNWTWQTVQVSEKDLAQSNTREVQLAEIESPGASLAIMQVWFLQVPDGVSLSQFADSYTRARGFKTVEKAAEVGNRMDMLISYDTSKQKDIQSRVTAIKIGKNVMWLACCAPRQEYSQWNRTFTLAANSFSPAAAPIAFQPDVQTKLAQGAVLVNEVTKPESQPTDAQSKSGIPSSNQAEKSTRDATSTATSTSTSTEGDKPVTEPKLHTVAPAMPRSSGSGSSSPVR